MATRVPGTARLAPSLSDFRRVIGNPALAALQDAEPDLYLALQQIVTAIILMEGDVNARVLRLETAPGVVIPDPPDVPPIVLSTMAEKIAFGYASLSSGTVTVNEPLVANTSIITVSYRGISGTPGFLSVPFSGMAGPPTSTFDINSYDALGVLNAADNSEVAWALFNPLT